MEFLAESRSLAQMRALDLVLASSRIPPIMSETVSDPHHFDFDLDRGIRAQVAEKLEGSPLLALEKGVGPPASGIYALFFKR
jgi:hypothetical protein